MATYYPQTVVYEEKKVTYWVLFIIPFIVLLSIFTAYNELMEFHFLPLFLFLIFAIYNMAFYSVKIFDDKTIQFGFPAWNKKLQPSEIKTIEQTSSYRPIKDFGGLGWRIGRKDGKWKRGYLVWLQKGIEIETINGTHYVFGTDNPEEILSLMR